MVTKLMPTIFEWVVYFMKSQIEALRSMKIMGKLLSCLKINQMRPLKPRYQPRVIKHKAMILWFSEMSKQEWSFKNCFCPLFIFEINESLLLIIDKLRSTSFSLTGILQSIFFCFEQMDSKSIQSIPLFFSSLLIISL